MLKSVTFQLRRWRDQNFVLVLAIIAILFGLIFGFSTSVIASAIILIDDNFHVSPLMNGFIVSSILVGAFCGSLFSKKFADLCGRRHLIIASLWLFIAGNIGIYFALSLWELILCRIVIGLVIGAASFVVPLYLTELLPSRYSGKTIVLNQLMATIGIAVSYIVGYFFSYGDNWRLMMSSVAIPAVLLLLGVLIIPESPRWLMMNGKEGEAWRVLRRIRRSFEIDVDLEEIKVAAEAVHRDWRVLLKKWLLPAVVIGVGLAIFRQFTGVNLFLYYAPTIFGMAGFKIESSAILITAIFGVLNILCTIIALPLLRRCGRRQLLLYGLAGATISWLLISLSFWLRGDADILRWLTVIGFALYIPSFAFSLGMVVFIIIYEIFPVRLRGIAASAVISLIWVCNVLVTFSFMPLVGIFNARFIFAFYFLVCVGGWLFVYFLVPETRNVNIERIEANLRLGKRWRALVDL